MKTYLKSKVDLEVILQDNTWFFEKGTIFVFEPVGWSVKYIQASYNTSSAYIKTECIRLNKVIYNKMISFHPEIKCEMTEIEENVVNTTFKHTFHSGGSSLSSYKVTNYTTSEIINNKDIFEDAIDYKRDDMIHNLIK
jgi:hypothetical protein